MLRPVLALAVLSLTATGAFARVADADHPTGLWVFEGTSCDAESLTGLRIAADEIIVYDPMRVSFSATIEGDQSEVSDFVDQRAMPSAITAVVETAEGYVFSVTENGSEMIDMTIAFHDDGTATLSVTLDFPMTVNLIPCGG